MIQIPGSVGMLRGNPPVVVQADFSGIGFSGFRDTVNGILHGSALMQDNQTFPVIVDCQRDLPGDQVLPYQIQHQQFRHLPDDQLSVREVVGLGQHLS